MWTKPDNGKKARRLLAARLLVIFCSVGIAGFLLYSCIQYLFSLERPRQYIAASAAPMPSPAFQEGKQNINTATLEQLDALPGIGPALAQAILDERTENNGFFFLEELMDVSGIGEKRFEAIKEQFFCLPILP